MSLRDEFVRREASSIGMALDPPVVRPAWRACVPSADADDIQSARDRSVCEKFFRFMLEQNPITLAHIQRL
jgi:hypothetical protein